MRNKKYTTIEAILVGIIVAVIALAAMSLGA